MEGGGALYQTLSTRHVTDSQPWIFLSFRRGHGHYLFYMVAIPAVVEAGAQTRFCVSLLQPSETLVMTVTLISQEKRTVLFEKTTSTEFHTCVQFQAPFVQENEVQNLKVEVQGATFHSEEVRKVMIKIYQPVTIIQTDKPIYLPGQTGNFKLMNYTVTPLSGDQYTSCLCANERKTLSWTMIPSVLGVVNVSVTAEAVASHMSCDNEIVSVPERGRIDVVTRPLIVKAEGTEMTKTYNWLLCPKGQSINVQRTCEMGNSFCAGDILGRALKNLDGLLKMPYGCGEQNMALLAPNIYILQYLKNTQQLTTTIKEKATNFLTSGYQRQLNYKHYDGAYSTFGTGVGNTWLTAFVLRSFVKAQSFVYIDPEKIRQTKDWLESKQQENGCFEQSGNLFNNRMKGGVSDEVTLSAYITAAFLEMNMSVTVMNRSLSCLNESISDLNNTYTTALLAYVFTLAGDMETRAHLLEQLDKVALNQGGFLHWSQTATETSASLSVEISSYVLLAKLSASPTAEDLAYANRIVRWLTGQQNQYGGFSSTQDTVVALQALALYSTLVFSLEGSSTVTVQSSSGQLTFDVNQDNKLLYQEVVLKDVTGKYSLEVKGTACASMQISLHYNIPTPVIKNKVLLCAKNIFLCFYYRYSGKQNSTNMVILDIKMLSGFVPDPQSLQMLKGALQVARIEEKTDHVLVYLQGLTKDIPINHSLQLVQEHSVQNLKPAVVKIYDYYQPSDQAETEYIFSCAAGNNG
uniref:Alpha-macroglobulin receptor-binding domain-containing protein n=1 Tax=Sparus aurata TaxID=8175 RepID=A0A671UXE6_SPAAU